MPERPSPTRTANVAFLVFFVLYTAGSIIWLLSGIPPVLASHSRAVHETLHRWGAGDLGFVVASKSGLGQRVTATSEWVPAKELAVWANEKVVIDFENVDRGVRHNFAIYRHDGSQYYRGPPTVGPAKVQIFFPAPPPGHYYFKDEFWKNPEPSKPVKPVELVAVAPGPVIPAWATATSCLLYTSPSPRDRQKSRMPSSA